MPEASLHRQTPVLESIPLSHQIGRRVLLKMEAWQPSGSFKIRGLGLVAQRAQAAGKTKLLSSSGGNAGLAVAYAGRRLGMPVCVYVPESTPDGTRETLRREGAEVMVHGSDWDDTHAFACEVAASDPDTAYVHPFDDPVIWEGHATLIAEANEQLKAPPGAVLVSVGGGGLLCGTLQGMHAAGWQDVPVLAVETAGADSFARSVQAEKLVSLPAITSLAKSLGARTVCQELLAWITRHEITPCVVQDRDAVAACTSFLNDHRTLVEPACGAALSLPYTRPDLLPDADSLLIIVCGGAGADLERLQTWQQATAE